MKDLEGRAWPLRLMDLKQGEVFRFAADPEVCTLKSVSPQGEWFVEDSHKNTMCYSGWWEVERISDETSPPR